MHYSSRITVSSAKYPGVTVTLLRMSPGRRKRLLESLGAVLQTHSAGERQRSDSGIDSARLYLETARLLLLWGVESIQGMHIDGKEVTIDVLIEDGPEDLCEEILAFVRRHALGEETSRAAGHHQGSPGAQQVSGSA